MVVSVVVPQDGAILASGHVLPELLVSDLEPIEARIADGKNDEALLRTSGL